MFKKIRLFLLVGLVIVLSGCTIKQNIDTTGDEILNQNNKIGLEVVFDGNDIREFEFDFEEGMNALNLLDKSGLEVQMKEYDFGAFVEGIDGVGGGGENKYWIYYVNDETGQVAADQYVLDAGDEVGWSFEEMSDNF